MRKEGASFARSLRQRETDAERKLWSRLRNRQMDGWKFRRQEPFGPYVLDFFCVDAGLVVEVDGGSHSEPEELERDANRTAYLELNGLTVIRFLNGEVLANTEGVIEAVYQALGQRPAPSPGVSRRPLPKGRGNPAQVAE